MRLLVGPGGALDLELSKEVGLLRLRFPLSRLESLCLLRELSDQSVTLLGQLAALPLLAMQVGVGFTQLLLQDSIGLYKSRKRKRRQRSTKKKYSRRGDPARLLSSRPESQGLQPAGAPARPRRERSHQYQQRRRIVAWEIRPDCSAVGPNLGDYSPQVRQRAPAKKEERAHPGFPSGRRSACSAPRRYG